MIKSQQGYKKFENQTLEASILKNLPSTHFHELYTSLKQDFEDLTKSSLEDIDKRYQDYHPKNFFKDNEIKEKEIYSELKLSFIREKKKRLQMVNSHYFSIEPIYCVAITPNNSFIISGCEDSTIRVWDFSTKKQVSILEGHLDSVLCLVLTSDGKKIISGSGDKTILIWDLESGNQIGILEGHTNTINSVRLSSDDSLLYSASADYTIKIWDLAEMCLITTLEEHLGSVLALELDNTGLKIISSGDDKTIKLWDLFEKKQLATMGLQNLILSMAVTHDNSLLFTGSDDNKISIRDLQTLKKLNEIVAHSDSINALIIYKNILVSGSSDNSIKIWSLDFDEHYNIQLNDTLAEHTQWVNSLMVDTSGNLLISGSSDKSIGIWSLKERKLVNLLKGLESVISLVLTPDNTKLISGNSDSSIRVWDLKLKKQIAKIEGHRGLISSLKVTPDGYRLISASEDRSIFVWSLKDKRPLAILRAHTNAVNVLELSSDGKILVSGGADNLIILWNLISSEKIEILEGHTEGVLALAIDKERIISGSLDKTIRIWSLNDFKQTSILEGFSTGIRALLIHPTNPNILLIAVGSTIKIWELTDTNKELKTLEAAHTDLIRSIKFLPSFNRIITAGSDTKLILWDINDFSLIKTYTGHTDEITCLEVNSEGSKVISGSHDRLIRIWDLKTDKFEVIKANSTDIYLTIVSPEGSKALIASSDNKIRIWDLDMNKLIGIIDSSSHVNCLQFTPNSERIVAGCGDNSIRIWDVKTKKALGLLKGHLNDVNAIVVTSDGLRIITGSSDESIIIWDALRRNKIRELEGHDDIITSLVITNEDHLISGSEDSTIKIWDLNIEVSYYKVKLTNNLGKIYSLSLSPDHKNLFSFSDNNTIMIWDLKELSIRNVLNNINYIIGIQPIFLSPNGRFFLLIDKIYDGFNNDLIYTHQFPQESNVSYQYPLYSEKKHTLYFIKSNNSIVKYNHFFQSYVLCLKNNHSFFDSNFKDKPEEILNRTNVLFPFFYSFLHLIAIYENENPFCFKMLEKLKAKLNLGDFLKLDNFGNTCFDIMIMRNHKSLLSNVFELFFLCINEDNTRFFEKIKFFQFSFKSKTNIFNLFNDLIKLYDRDLHILNKILNLSFLPPHYSLYNNDLNFQELEEPIFIVTHSIYSITQEFIKEQLSMNVYKTSQNLLKTIFKSKPKNPKNSFVKCKIIALPHIIDYRENSKSTEFFCNLLDYPSSHPIFSNEVLKLVTDYKWKRYIKPEYFKEFYFFLIFLILFMINFIFLVPLRLELEGTSFNFYEYLSIICDIVLFFYSIKCLTDEIKQAKKLKLTRYLGSFWNAIDISLIFLLIISSCFDLMIINQIPIISVLCKISNSLTMLFFFIRLLSYVRGFDGTSFMIALIAGVIKESQYFIYILLLCISAFACSIHLLQTDVNTNILNSFNMFYRLTLGDFNYLDDYVVESPFMLWAYMIMSTLLLTIILLNLLIALLSDTYAKVSKYKEQSRNYELMNINYEIESFLSKKDMEELKEEKVIGKFLVYLFNETHE